MKLSIPRLCLALFLSLPVIAYAQDKKIYYDEGHQKTDMAHAAYYTVYKPEGNKYKMTEYTAGDNKLERAGYCLTPDSESMDGACTFYTAGIRSGTGNYDNNRRNGIWTYYYANTDKVWYTEQYDENQLIAITSYYEDGKKKRDESHADQRGVTGKCYDESGNEIPFTPFYMMPAPQYDLGSFLSAQLHYPEKAKENLVSGRVIVRFYIDTDSSITNVSVVKHLGGGCDQEAMRVIKEMPKWKPGTMDGTTTKMLYMLPVTFQFH